MASRHCDDVYVHQPSEQSTAVTTFAALFEPCAVWATRYPQGRNHDFALPTASADVWYAGMMVLCLTVAGASVYLGLERYLGGRCGRNSAIRRVRLEKICCGRSEPRASIGSLLKWTICAGNQWTFHPPGPPDGSVMSQSGPPRDKSFDPADIPTNSKDQAPGTLVSATRRGMKSVVFERYALRRWWHLPSRDRAPYAAIERVLHEVLIIFLIGMPLVVAAAAMGALTIVRHGLSPIQAITQQAERISSLNLWRASARTQNGRRNRKSRDFAEPDDISAGGGLRPHQPLHCRCVARTAHPVGHFAR